MPIREAFRR